MSRLHPIAGVYKLTCRTTGKVYIGESSCLSDRMSAYRTFDRGRAGKRSRGPKRKIDIAIKEHGLSDFDVEFLETSETDNRLFDTRYRREREALYIWKYRAKDPEYGYNSRDDNKGYRFGKRKGVPTKTSTKIVKCDPLLAYNHKDESVMMFLGAESCAKQLGFTDRAIIIRCMHNGKSSHGYTFFKLSFAKRLEDATNIIKYKLEHSNTDRNGRCKRSLEVYLKALYAANEWCIEFGMECIDIDQLMNTI